MSSNNQGTDINAKDIKAAIKFWVFSNNKFKISSYIFVPLPDWLPLRNGFKKCDMAIGPCACGAWHHKNDERSF